MRFLRGLDPVTLPERLQALARVVAVGSGRLPVELIGSVQDVLDRAGERRRYSTTHTVVALAGATGSGKSSLFNAMTGMDVAAVGVRRPTTGEPMACIWGEESAEQLLGWLGVPARRQVAHESELDADESRADGLDGLVLLDLPDHDSTEVEHRATVDRLVEMVDLFVWVLDPQKYADAALHDRYLRPLASHQAVTVVVLNQIDRLSPADAQACAGDLRELLNRDGLDKVPVVLLSALTGEGVDDLIGYIRTAVREQRVVEERITADVRMTAGLIERTIGAGEPGNLGAEDRRRLLAALSDASGIDVVTTAVGRSVLRRAREATGWPVTRWVARLRPDPLVRLGAAARRGEVDTDLMRMALPQPTPVQRARSDTAIRELGDTAAGSLAGPWRDAIRSVAADSANRFPGALDDAVASTDFQIARTPRWWTAVNVVQWLALGAAAVGVLWLLALAGASFLRFDVGNPSYGGLPVPTLLLVGGVAVGIVVAALSFAAAHRSSRRRAAAVGRGLREVLDRTAADVVWGPLEAELDRHQEFSQSLTLAHSK